jgi:hypothetical protein
MFKTILKTVLFTMFMSNIDGANQKQNFRINKFAKTPLTVNKSSF